MQNITSTGRLNYRYTRTAIGVQDKEDSVSMDVANIRESGLTDQTYHFFSGENHRPYQDRKNVTGNGLLMLFLEWDIHELQRQTGGSWRHFQRLIRWALAAGGTKKEVLISYQKQEIKGIQFIIQPYAKDEKSVRYGAHANKYYCFTLADGIPGTIYEIRTIVPETSTWKEGDELIIDERIVFTDFTPERSL